MSEVIPAKKREFEDKLRKIKNKEKILKEREKKSLQKRLIDLGMLAVKAKISEFDKDALLGAFLEIAERFSDAHSISKWREKSTMFSAGNEKGHPLTISFKSPPSVEIKNQLKHLKFKWHSFRGEYYGFGDARELSELLKNHDCKIEMIK